MSTLVLFVGSVLALSSPAQAAADKTMEITYRCTGGTALTPGDVKATVTVPDSVEPGKTATVKWKFSTLKAAKALTASTQTTSSGGDLTVTSGTPTPLKGTGTGTVPTAGIPAQSDFTPPEMTATVTAPSTAGTMTLMPVSTTTAAALQLKVGTDTADCTYSSVSPTTGISIDVKTVTGGGTDGIVTYDCDLGGSGGGDADYPVDVRIKVGMTAQANATANADATITWTGTIQSGDSLKAPTGFPTNSPKMFVTIKASGAGVPSSPNPTGEATLGTVTIGQPITLPTSVTIKVKPTTTGTVTLTPGDLAFGTSASSPAIKCLAPTSSLPTFTFTVGSSTGTPTTSSTPTNTTSTPKPTKTSTATVTVTPSSSTKKSKTPKAGADTGGGGEAGPDGRMFILTGTALVGAAAVGGLVMRRRNATRG
ncbi:hypothetical protein AB0J35_52790 [Nonomuraea angiospora]|uniref:hypothetical protein n=1 Tax=Nonomuraea angiospora TaxID=46172 RepID=UPI00342BBD9B